MHRLDLNGRRLHLTEDGFLLDRSQWDREVARALAAQDRVELTDRHWEIIEFVRAYYDQYHIVPIMRILARAIGKRLGEDKGKSKYLRELFPSGTVGQASRYAGLPKPPSCI